MNQTSERMLCMFSVAAGETDTPPMQATVTVRRCRGGCWCPWKVVSHKVAQFSFKDSRRDPIFGSVSSARTPLVVETLFHYLNKDPNNSMVDITLDCLYNKQLVAQICLQEFLYALLSHGSDGQILFLVQNGEIVLKDLLSAQDGDISVIYSRQVWPMITVGKSKHRKWSSDVSDLESLDTVDPDIMDCNDTDSETERHNIDSDVLDWNDTDSETEHNINIVDDESKMKNLKKVGECDEEEDEILNLEIMNNPSNVVSEVKDFVGIGGIDEECKNGYFQKTDIGEQTAEINANKFKELDNESKIIDLGDNSKEKKDECNQFTKYWKEGSAKEYTISNIVKNYKDDWQTKEEIIIGEDVASRISVNEYMADDEQSDMEPKLKEIHNTRENLSYREKYENNDCNVKCDTKVEDYEYFADDEQSDVEYLCRKTYYNEIPKGTPLLSDTEDSCREDLNDDDYEYEYFGDGEESEDYEGNVMNVEAEQQDGEQQIGGVVSTIVTRCRRIGGTLIVALSISLTVTHVYILIHYIVYETV